MSKRANSDLSVIAEEEKVNRAEELITANLEKAKREEELVIANVEKAKRDAELAIAYKDKAERAAELVIANIEKANREAELAIANKEKAKREAELVIAKEEKAERAAELVIANKEKASREEELAIANAEKALRAAELIITNTAKAKRAAELVIANAEKAKSAAILLIANIEKEKTKDKLIDADKELTSQHEEKIKLATELVIADINKTKLEAELAIANIDKAKRAAELVIANKEVVYQKGEKTKRASELVVADTEKAKRESELVIANIEKAKRAAELVIANVEKTKRSAELVIANKELIYQKSEKAKRAAELLIANVEKAKQAAELVIANIEKAKRAAQFIVLSKELKLAKEKDNLVAELTNVNKELCLQITERKFFEKELLKLSRAVEQSPASIIITDLKGNIEYVNPKTLEITGYTKVELIGKNPRIFSSGEKSKEEYKQLWSAISAGNEWIGEFPNNKKSGELYWESASISSVFNESGEATHYVAVKEDITERKKLLEELIKAKEHAEESDRLKSAFLANMSHEIRTPMNGILGFAELLREPDLTGDKQQEYIKIIEKSGLRMLNIINNIVDISKIESGLMEVYPMKSNVNEQMDFICTFFNPEIERKGLQLVLKKTLSAEEAIITTDREKIYAILTNLVNNAIKYTDKGSIEFGCEKKGGNLEFFVKDTGIGIPKDRQEAIFERFIQADINDKMARQGAGLGLSITKAYVEMLGGKIWVESEEGIGSAFYFTLPYTTVLEGKKIVPAQDEENQINPEVSELKILIAEDDETSEMLITIDVGKFGKEILKARNGFEAVEVCRNNPDIDLILMDIQMPVMNGYDATRQIRQFNKDVIIIAQTAFGLSGDREKAIVAGCNNHISKPINKDELLMLIQKYFMK